MGVTLDEEQLRAAAGKLPSFDTAAVELRRYGIDPGVYAEDPKRLLPSSRLVGSISGGHQPMTACASTADTPQTRYSLLATPTPPRRTDVVVSARVSCVSDNYPV
ncbi:MAG: hypothetical protein ACYCS7_10405 [Acidimicrobiales bacterium]